MHAKAKARIDQAAERVDSSKEIFNLLSKKGKLIDSMKTALVELCDDALESGLLSKIESSKVVSLRSKIIIEL